MSSDKGIYMREDFFENDTISWLEEQENGTSHILVYLKLCMEASKNNGVIDTKNNDLVDIIDMNEMPIETTINLFKELGILEEKENSYILKYYDEIVKFNIEDIDKGTTKGVYSL